MGADYIRMLFSRGLLIACALSGVALGLRAVDAIETDKVVPEGSLPDSLILKDSVVSEDHSLRNAFLYSSMDKSTHDEALDNGDEQDLESELQIEAEIEAAIKGGKGGKGGPEGSGAGSHHMGPVHPPVPGTAAGSGASDCAMCVAKFNAAGGCEAMLAGQDPTHLIPAGCDHCGEHAGLHCEIHHVMEHIEQELTFDMSPEDFHGALQTLIENAYADALGLWDHNTHGYTTGTTITSHVVTSPPAGSLLELMPETDFEETSSSSKVTTGTSTQVHVTVDTTNTAAGAKANTMTSATMASDMAAVAKETGNKATPPTLAKVSSAQVTTTTPSKDNGAASSSPTLIASCIVLLTTLHIFTKSA